MMNENFDGCLSWILAGVVLCGTFRLEAQYETPQNPRPSTAFVWPEGKRGAVSLTFDDARPSQLTNGIPLFRRHALRATFYLSPTRVPEHVVAWRAAIGEGHEMGNHTMRHPCTGNFVFARAKALEDYTLEDMTRELLEANQSITDLLGVIPVSFAYPCGQSFVGRGTGVRSYVPLIAKHFQTGRLWLSENSNDPGFCDFSQLLGMESDGKDYEELEALVANAAAGNRWLILCGHEIAEAGRQTTRLAALDRLCGYLSDPSNGLWVDTIGRIADYLATQRNAPSAR